MLAFRISSWEKDVKKSFKTFTLQTTQNKIKQVKVIRLKRSSITSMNHFKQYFQTILSEILMNIWQNSKKVPQWGKYVTWEFKWWFQNASSTGYFYEFDLYLGRKKYIQGYSQGKTTLKLNSRAYEKYEYGHLGCWYIKLTLFQRF